MNIFSSYTSPYNNANSKVKFGIGLPKKVLAEIAEKVDVPGGAHEQALIKAAEQQLGVSSTGQAAGRSAGGSTTHTSLSTNSLNSTLSTDTLTTSSQHPRRRS